jgi:hypothetical protein
MQLVNPRAHISAVGEDYSNYFDEIVNTYASSSALQHPNIEDSEVSDIECPEILSASEVQCSEQSDGEGFEPVERWSCLQLCSSTPSVEIPDNAEEYASGSSCETPSTCAGCEDQSLLPIECCWAAWSAGDSPTLRHARLGMERPPAQCRTGWDNDEAVDEPSGRGLEPPDSSRFDGGRFAQAGVSLAPDDAAGAALTACTACPCSPLSFSDVCFPCLSWDLCAVE